MMIGLVITGSGDSKWIGVSGVGRVKTTRFSSGESLASRMASRSVPRPESPGELTSTASLYGMTRTVKAHELELPEASTAVQVTVFEPTGNVQVTVLDMVWQREAVGDEQVTVGWLSQRSVASGNGN